MTTAAAPAMPSVVTAGDRLGLTIFLAASVHAVLILGIAFQPQDAADLKPPAALEIILVQNNSNKAPEKADYLAQTAQTGGGESELRERPGNPFTSTELHENPGIAPQPIQGGQKQHNPDQQQAVITQLHSEHKTRQIEQKKAVEKTHPQRDEITDFDLEIARLAAELKQEREAYAKRPKKMVLTANTHEYLPASYMHAWVEKVERIGNLNYPDQALRHKLEGTLMLEVELRWDGSIVEINLLQSSGHRILDDAAMRIVELSSPFAAFPGELRKAADHLEIIRSWQFINGNLNTE